jgi:hypothetical protein
MPFRKLDLFPSSGQNPIESISNNMFIAGKVVPGLK